ncbi:MAG: UPF0262 family protein [Alphaproteobacteria bacterium]
MAGNNPNTALEIHRLVAVTMDDSLAAAGNPDIAHERDIAIFDLIDDNHFSLVEASGPYSLHLSIIERRLVLKISANPSEKTATIILSLTPFRRIMRDYFLICETYYEAIRTAPPSQIEAIDMGRRGLHDEGSQVLRDRLSGKVEMNFQTARRLFTVICALHRRG